MSKNQLKLLKIEKCMHNIDETADFSNIGWSNIPVDILSKINVLNKKILLLNSNTLNEIENKYKILLINIVTLNLYNNQIKSISSIHETFPNLVTLDISKNRLTKLDDSIKKLKSLQILNISSNLFVKFPIRVMMLDRLVHLNVSNNNIKLIPRNCIKYLYDLNSLICDNCGFNIQEEFDLISNLSEIHQDSQKNKRNVKISSELDEEIYYIDYKKSTMQNSINDTETTKTCIDDNILRNYQSCDDIQYQYISKLKQNNEMIDEKIKNFEFPQSHLAKLKDLQNISDDYMLNKIDNVDPRCKKKFLNQIQKNDQKKIASYFQNNLNKMTNQMEELKLNDSKILHIQRETNKNSPFSKYFENQKAFDGYINQILDNKKIVEDINHQNDLRKYHSFVISSDLNRLKIIDNIKMVQLQLEYFSAIEINKIYESNNTAIEKWCSLRIDTAMKLNELLNLKDESNENIKNKLINIEIVRENLLKRYYDENPKLSKLTSKTLDRDMVDIMIMTSATEYYEIFIENYLNVDKIANTSIDTLVQMGISSKVANNLINHVKENYTKDVNVELENPKLSETNQLNLKNLPISTYEAEEECVICMEKMCDVIFLMCGHICTCSICTNRVEICPLCRSNIEKRMKKY